MKTNIKQIVEKALLKPEVQNAIKDAISDEITRHFSQQVRGENVYFPKNLSNDDRAQRDQRIRNEFNGSNLKELAEKHGVSHRQARRIVSGMKPFKNAS